MKCRKPTQLAKIGRVLKNVCLKTDLAGQNNVVEETNEWTRQCTWEDSYQKKFMQS